MTDEHPRLIGAHEIRGLLGVSRQRVYQLAGQSGFPKPVATLAQGKIWLVDDIETWIGAHRSPRPPRPDTRRSSESRMAPPSSNWD